MCDTYCVDEMERVDSDITLLYCVIYISSQEHVFNSLHDSSAIGLRQIALLSCNELICRFENMKERFSLYEFNRLIVLWLCKPVGSMAFTLLVNSSSLSRQIVKITVVEKNRTRSLW